MKKIIISMLVCLSLLVGLMLANTFMFKSKQMVVEAAPDVSMDRQHISRRLSRAIQCKTISHQESTLTDIFAFKSFHKMLSEVFPKAHQHLKREIVNDLSLLYTWQGTRDDIKPIMFLAHMDVVPIADGTIDDWAHPPFEGKIDDGFIWGRGTLDDKACLMGIFEAVELLVAEGFRPDRTIYIALGHDEEVGGQQGASKIADLLKSRHVKTEWILDEGGLIMLEAVPGFKRPIALIGVAEKGYVTLEFSVKTAGGHSSMPPPRTAIGMVANAIAKLERSQFPAKYDGILADMFAFIGPELPIGMKLLFANNWLFRPVIKYQLKKIPSMNAMLRTTTAPTVIQAGTKENILPQKASALVNFRLYPGDTLENVLDHVKNTINDEAIHIKPTNLGYNEASPVTNADSEHFQKLQKTIQEVFSDAIVAPYLMVAGTDTKHYTDLTDNIFRFLPLRIKHRNLERFHGTNERLNIEDYRKLIQFYSQLIRSSS